MKRSYSGETITGACYFQKRRLEHLSQAAPSSDALEQRIHTARFGGFQDTDGFQTIYDVTLQAAKRTYEFDVIATPAVHSPRTETLGPERYEQWAEGMGRLRYIAFPTFIARLTEAIENVFLGPWDLLPPFITYRPTKRRLSPFAPIGPWSLKPTKGPFEETIDAHLSIEKNKVRVLYRDRSSAQYRLTPFAPAGATQADQLAIRLPPLLSACPDLTKAFVAVYGPPRAHPA